MNNTTQVFIALFAVALAACAPPQNQTGGAQSVGPNTVVQKTTAPSPAAAPLNPAQPIVANPGGGPVSPAPPASSPPPAPPGSPDSSPPNFPLPDAPTPPATPTVPAPKDISNPKVAIWQNHVEQFQLIEPKAVIVDGKDRRVAWLKDGTPVYVEHDEREWDHNSEAAGHGGWAHLGNIFAHHPEVRTFDWHDDKITQFRKGIQWFETELNDPQAKLFFFQLNYSHSCTNGHTTLAVVDLRNREKEISVEFFDSDGPAGVVRDEVKSRFEAVADLVKNRFKDDKVAVKIHSDQYQIGGRCYLHVRNAALQRYEGISHEEFAEGHTKQANFTSHEIQRMRKYQLKVGFSDEESGQNFWLGKAIVHGTDQKWLNRALNTVELLNFRWEMGSPLLSENERNAMIVNFAGHQGVSDADLAERLAWAKKQFLEKPPASLAIAPQ